MVKVLITGATGLLGRSTFNAFKSLDKSNNIEVCGTSFSRKHPDLINIDLRDLSALTSLIEGLKPDIVIHCAAERRPDVCEKDPKAVQSLNVLLPSHLSTLSLSPQHPFFLIYISTDYVFPGIPPSSEGYEPGDEVGPANLYGVSKREGEEVVLKGLEKGGRGCCLRVPVLYGPTEQNSESAINCLLDVIRSTSIAEGENKIIKMDNWAIRYPTNVLDVARVLIDLSLLSLPPCASSSSIPKILHFSTQNPLTKVEICHILARLSGIELTEKNFKSIDEGPKVEEGETMRPRDCHLSNNAIEALGIDTSDINFESWWKEWLATESERK